MNRPARMARHCRTILPGRRGLASAPRRGIMVVVALVCLLIASILTTGLVRRALVERRQAALNWAVAQADWLVESGRQRAAAKLLADPAYEGETWWPPDGASGQPTGEVQILVERAPQEPSARRLLISATCTGAGDLPCRRVREVTIRHFPLPVRPGAPSEPPTNEDRQRATSDDPAMRP